MGVFITVFIALRTMRSVLKIRSIICSIFSNSALEDPLSTAIPQLTFPLPFLTPNHRRTLVLWPIGSQLLFVFG